MPGTLHEFDHGVHVGEHVAGPAVVRRRRRLHRVTFLAVSALLGVAALDGLGVVDAVGVDTDEQFVEANGISLRVEYPSVTRPALAAPFRIDVRRDGGFDGPVTVAVERGYLELWDVNGILPAPSAETNDGDWILWEFDPPEGDLLRITYEARIEPGAQSARSGAVAVRDDDGATLAELDFRTRVRP